MRRLWIVWIACLSITATAWGATNALRPSSAKTHKGHAAGQAHRGKHKRGKSKVRSKATKAKGKRAGVAAVAKKAAGADPVLFGDQTVESTLDSNPAGSAEAFPFANQAAGSTLSIAVYLDSSNRASTLVAGLYSNRNGHPGSRLASGSLSSPASGAWNTVSIGSASVKAGSTYWVAILGKGGSLFFRDRANGPCTAENSAQSALTSLPSKWSDGAQWKTCPASVYVNGLLAATASVAPANTALPAVTGFTVEGQTLTASNGSWSGSPTAYAYQWQDCDTSGANCANINGASASTYTLTSGDVAHTMRAIVTARNTGGSASATSAQTGVVALPPAPTAAFSYSPTSPVTGAQVSFDATTSSCADAPCTYIWNDDGAEPPTGSWPLGTGSTMQFTFQAAGTKYVRLTVQDVDGRTATIEHNVVVNAQAVSPPANTGSPQVSGTVMQGNVLTASNGAWSGSPTSYSYQWKDCDSAGSNCADISGASSSSYMLSANDVNHTIVAVVTATNTGGSTAANSTQTAIVTVPPSPPSNSALPQVSGSTTQGSVLTTSNGTWSGGSPSSYGYKWQDCDGSGANCASISGAGTSTYTLAAADVGHTVRAVVTATNSGGSTSATSAQTAVIAAPAPPAAPANTALPQISGTPTQGNALTASNGSWSGSPTSYSYQWQDCDSAGANCTNISGATSTSYTLVAGDVSHTLRATVSAVNAGGSASATSAATSLVAAASGTPKTCVTQLGACGYPDGGGNDGVPAGTSLTPYAGTKTITTAGTVINGVSCTDCSFDIEASNVTIQNSRITMANGGNSGANIIAVGFTNHNVSGVKFINDEIAGQGTSSSGYVNAAITNRGTNALTIQGSYIHGCEDCIVNQPWGAGTFNMSDTYVASDAWEGSSPHYEPFYECPGGSGNAMNLQHDTLLNPIDQTADYIVDNGTCGNLTGGDTINNSFLAGGGFAIYGGQGASLPATFTNNRFSNYYQTHGVDSFNGGAWQSGTCNLSSKLAGCFGTTTAMPSGMTWSGNYWDDTLATVTP